MPSPIIDKIRKLLSLATSTNANEAAAAARAADRLIAEHNISQAELELAGELSAENPEIDVAVLYETSKLTQWKSNLAVILTEHYGVAIWNDLVHGASAGGRVVNRYRLVGRKSDLEIVHYMFGYLMDEVNRLAKALAAGRGAVYSQSFCRGCVQGIKAQLVLQKQESRAKAEAEGHSTALVLIDSRKEQAKLALQRHVPKLRKAGTFKSGIDPNAFAEGKEAGQSIRLQKALNQGGPNKQLK